MTDQPIEPTLSKNTGRLKRLGFTITGLWLTVALIYVAAVWPNVRSLKPDEFADFLGGVFGPLAFLWLVLGYFQQGEELRQSVEALKLQARELGLSVEQQRELVAATREQIEYEQSVAAAREAAEIQRAAPRLRITPQGLHSNGTQMIQEYMVQNFGTLCTDVTVSITPNGFKLDWPRMQNSDQLLFNLQHDTRDNLAEQSVLIDFRDGRDVPGSAKFRIPVIENLSGGPRYGNPEPV